MTRQHFPGHIRPVRKPTAGQRVEDLTLVLILLAVGVAAGAGSFTHVHDWTMNNSPAGKADWFGWANAVISELVPVAALLVIRRRKRAGQPITYPAFLLILALALSVTAQLAVAKPGLSGAQPETPPSPRWPLPPPASDSRKASPTTTSQPKGGGLMRSSPTTAKHSDQAIKERQRPYWTDFDCPRSSTAARHLRSLPSAAHPGEADQVRQAGDARSHPRERNRRPHRRGHRGADQGRLVG